MPRPAGVRKNMTTGWNDLHKHWQRDLASKLEDSHRLLETVLGKHRSPVVCWSGGKDSTVVLHLARQQRPNMPVIYVDSGVEFPESVQFVHELAALWNLNLMVARPVEGKSFWDIGSRYGWPIFGKSTASNVARARRTGNIRPQMSSLEKRWLETMCVSRHSVCGFFRRSQARQ